MSSGTWMSGKLSQSTWRLGNNRGRAPDRALVPRIRGGGPAWAARSTAALGAAAPVTAE